LETLLRAGYVNKERAAQIAEKREIEEREKYHEALMANMMKEEYEEALKQEKIKEKARQQQMLDHKLKIHQQLREQVNL
jgi:hypothetical protein